MSFESFKRPNQSYELNGSGTLDQRKRIRATNDEERQFKRKLSKSPDGQPNKMQHISNGITRPPIIPLMPSQRLDLFKKRQKWRQTTFYKSRNYLAKGRDQSARSSREPSAEIDALITTTSNYVEASTQTDSIPSLKSKYIESKKTIDLKAKSGIFSGEILYDSEELDEGKNKSPVKFPDSKATQNRALPVASGTLNALLNDKRKITQTEKLKPVEEPIKPIPSIELQPSKETSVGPSAGFNFLNSKPKKIEELNDDIKSTITTAPENKPIHTYSFGASHGDKKDSPATNNTFSLGTNITDIKDTSTPAFSFSSKVENKEASKPASKSAFSFGTKSDTTERKKSTDASLFGSKSDAEKPPVGFSLGFKPTEENKDEPKPTFPFGSKEKETASLLKPEESKPAFSFGGALSSDKPAFSFDSKPSEESSGKEEQPKAAFSFGASQDKEKSAPAPSFSFGATKFITDATKPAFSLGSSADDAKDKPSTTLFGGKSGETEDKPTFGFGAKSDAAIAASKPSFSFGSKGGEKADAPAKPAFSFGASQSNGLFGASTEKKEEIKEQPKFSFGASKPETEDEPSRKKTTIGSTDIKPSFSFGSTTSTDKPIEGPKTSGFAFGASSTENKSDPGAKKPVFSFGKTAKPAFSFGASSTSLPASSSTPLIEKPAFNFGGASTNQDSKPSLGFGSPAPTTAATTKPSGFNFGATSKSELSNAFGASSNTAAKPPSTVFSFGNSSTPQPNPASVFGQPSAAPTASSTPFNFGTTTQPLFGADTQQQQSNTKPAFENASSVFGNQAPAAKPSFATGGSVNFNFGAGSSTPAPASVFGAQQNNTPFGGQQPAFGTPQPQQVAASGFNFGAAQAPAFGGAALGAASPFGASTPAPGAQPQPRIPGRKIAQIRRRRG